MEGVNLVVILIVVIFDKDKVNAFATLGKFNFFSVLIHQVRNALKVTLRFCLCFFEDDLKVVVQRNSIFIYRVFLIKCPEIHL